MKESLAMIFFMIKLSLIFYITFAVFFLVFFAFLMFRRMKRAHNIHFNTIFPLLLGVAKRVFEWLLLALLLRGL